MQSRRQRAQQLNPQRLRRHSVFVAGFGALMAVLGVLNLTISYIGGAVWTYVAFGGAVAAGLAARDLRKLARRIEQSADHPADPS